jgi:hypothetical protein
MSDDEHICVYREIAEAVFGSIADHCGCYIDERGDSWLIDGDTSPMSEAARAKVREIMERAYQRYAATREGINGRAASTYFEHRANLGDKHPPAWRNLPETEREFWRNVVREQPASAS